MMFSSILVNEKKKHNSLEWLRSRITILNWLPLYSKNDLLADIISGITIGLTVLPQSMAYASLGGLKPQFGLYSSFMGCFIYTFFGTIKEVSIGPTSLMAILAVGYTRDLPVEFMILITFLSGCVQLLFGIFQLSFLVDFISLPTVSGFQSATSVLIIVSQLKYIFGIKYKSSNFANDLYQIFNRLSEFKLYDAILGVGSIIFLLSLRKLGNLKISKNKPKLKKALWLLSISRNALVVILCSLLAFFYESTGNHLFTVTGNVTQGLPAFKVPKFHTIYENKHYSFFEMCKKLEFGILVVPMIAILGNVTIAKAFASGKIVDSTQEMITLGLCNIFGSFVQSMPTSGAFTRSAVSNASGVRTPLSGIFSGTLVVLALVYLTPYFFYITKPTLAAVLISAVMFMIDYSILKPLWKTSKLDFFTTVITFILSLMYGVEIGLLAGTLINIGNLLRLWARPKIVFDIYETNTGRKYIKITPSIGLFYPAVDYLQTEISKIALHTEHEDLTILIDCRSILSTDYTAVKGLQAIIKNFEKRDQKLLFTNINATVKEAIQNLQKVGSYASTESKLHNLIDGGVLKTEEMLPFISDNEIHIKNMQKDTNLNLKKIGSNLSLDSLHKIKVTKS